MCLIGLGWYEVGLWCVSILVHLCLHALLCQLCPTLCNPMDCRLLCPWDSPGKNTGVGCQALLQGIFPTQRLNLCLFSLLHWPAGICHWNHLGSPTYTHVCICFFWKGAVLASLLFISVNCGTAEFYHCIVWQKRLMSVISSESLCL